MRIDNQLGWLFFPLGLVSLLGAYPAMAAIPDGPVEGFGVDLPLAQAVEAIIPAGLPVAMEKDVDPTSPVSWEGGPSWKEVLRNALTKAGYVPKIEETAVLVGLAPPPAQNWEIFEGETVAQTISRWSSQAGYTPVPAFSAQDRWRLFVTQHFSGSFEDALEWLSRGFSRQSSKPIFYLGANKTIDILSQPTGTSPIDAETGSF